MNNPLSSRTSSPLSRATAFVLLEVGVAMFVAAGPAERLLGPATPWMLLGAAVLGGALRMVDLEGCALFVPGGLYGMARQAFGLRTASFAASAQLLNSIVFGALTASAAGHAFAGLGALIPRLPQPLQKVTLDDAAMTMAACLVGAVWWWQRQGRPLSPTTIARQIWIAVAALSAAALVGVLSVIARHHETGAFIEPFRWQPLSFTALLGALGLCLLVAGSGDALSQAGTDVPAPRILHLRRIGRLVGVVAVVLTSLTALLYVGVVPAAERTLWRDVPLAGAAWFAAPTWAGLLLVPIVAAASIVLFGLAAYRSIVNAERFLLRLSEDGVLTRALRAPHPRFGTPAMVIDLITLTELTLVVSAAGQLTWLARVYGALVAMSAVLKIAALIRLRRRRPEARAYRFPLNLRALGRERPIGLFTVGAVFAGAAALLLVTADPATIAAAGMLVVASALLSASERRARESAASSAGPGVEMLLTPAIGLDGLDVRPGNLLVALRRPGALGHLAAALQSAGQRDVVVLTVRLAGVDVSEDAPPQAAPTDEERRLLTEAALLAERYGQVVRLAIVPATNVFEAIADAAVRLRTSDVYVGESETLSADDQARRLGDAWEHVPEARGADVRLIVHHSSGRTAVYHLGAHQPTLSTDDLHLIHAVWLDAVKAVGPHVHHRDIVRAALKHMQEELNDTGPARDAALDRIRQSAHTADELASVVRQRDFARLRDMLRNRPPSDLAAVFTDLSLEDQVVLFRVVPRKVAATIFEYLSHDAQQALLKAMAQEDVAAILNNMAPDDRTMFLEELPAAATQQMLTLLTPQERSVAVTLLGYPEKSIGRLMTPDYIAVREQWTVQEVLDYIRTHGQNSETLNVIYVVDDKGVLIDDIRIREFLLTSPSNRVADLMDRRYIALNAADDQRTAVTVFRREDRSALPVTDSTGVLIGIVTIDDVLDVADDVATTEIQRIGGSEALDEPYMEIAFLRMIKKRAGWLTALFLGEMLTATAMGAFEHEIERAVVLALFVPLIISSGGNSGSQASTLVIRALALGEVTFKDWWRVMRREVAAGLTLGGILGTIGFLRITVWSTFSTLYGEHWLLVALTVGLALIGVVLWGTLIGSLLPFVLRRLGFDPAVSSAPFVATIVDVTGLVIYFSVGLVVLRGTLL